MKEYSIKEISQLCDLKPSTLRYYEEVGLLQQVRRNASKQRVYTQEHIDRLHAIECFKNTGMSIADIGRFFEYETNEQEHIGDVLELLEMYRKESYDKMKKGLEAYAHLFRKIEYYQAIGASFATQTAHPQWESYRDKDYMPQVRNALLGDNDEL